MDAGGDKDLEDGERRYLLAFGRAYAQSILANALRRQAAWAHEERKGRFGFPMGEAVKLNIVDEDDMRVQTEGTAALTGWPYSVPKGDEPYDVGGPYGEQYGGEHYRKYAIQPTQYIIRNKLGFCEGNVVKYITRYKDKGGVEDLKKARHYIDMLIEEQK
jgi:hypothetical protein